MADNTFILEVVTPEHILFKDEIQFVVTPAVEGELGVLRNHAPMVASLGIGVLRYTDPEGMIKRMAISGGFMEVVDNTARVLAETAEHGDEIDVLRAKASLDRAQKRIEAREEELNFIRAQMSLQRALARIKAAEGKLD
ncbi:MAG: F0F1 ATP synthase subunit epsilon [Syntrophomonadaceae bacterium]|mgnify:CR=1 FL=1|nr:F0F1 ATP synthase subunit epsilon [Syntrophomonadaceae bacterium]